MKVLIVPMAALAETHGPSGRCRILAESLRRAGIGVATCMAEDVNYKAVTGVTNYFLDVPMPLGLPAAIASRTFPIAQKLGITARKTVESFDQVLMYTGNLDYSYLKRSVASIRAAISDFRPDIVYSEFNISAIIAARKEGVRLFTTVSYPTQYGYAHKDRTAKGLNRLLEDLSLPKVDSALQLFDLADKAFCMSIRELEPVGRPDVIFCGSLKGGNSSVEGAALDVSSGIPSDTPSGGRNKILVYMGSGTISPKKMKSVVEGAFAGSPYEVYIASSYLEEGSSGNIHIAGRWDFDTLLPESVLLIDHGGQNSIVDGLINGVPQIIVPGRIFERKYNARSVADNQAGAVIGDREFTADDLRGIADKVIHSDQMAENAAVLGSKLAGAGGADLIVKTVLEG